LFIWSGVQIATKIIPNASFTTANKNESQGIISNINIDKKPLA
jgi:hypothetical protein